MVFTCRALKQLKAEFATFLSSTEKCSGAVFGERDRKKACKDTKGGTHWLIYSHIHSIEHIVLTRQEFCESHTKH